MSTAWLTTMSCWCHSVGSLSPCQSSLLVVTCMETYVLLTASNISCASLLTPLPFCWSCFFISRIVCSSLAISAAMSTFAMLGTALSNPAFVCCPRSPRPTISKFSMCANGMMWYSPGCEEIEAEGFGGAGAVLIAIAFVVLHAVNRVPSRTLLFGAHVILILRSVSPAVLRLPWL
jgi:hypothetical protein